MCAISTYVPIERLQERARERHIKTPRNKWEGTRVWRGGCPFMPQVLKHLHALRAPALDPGAKI